MRWGKGGVVVSGAKGTCGGGVEGGGGGGGGGGGVGAEEAWIWMCGSAMA